MEDQQIRLVHPRIAAPVAEALGVASRRRLMLAVASDSLAVSLTGGAVEAFGQSEALTTRLRHIIQVGGSRGTLLLPCCVVILSMMLLFQVLPSELHMWLAPNSNTPPLS